MLEILAILCILLALAILAILSHMDLKKGLLPDEYVLGLATVGFVFHLTTLFHYSDLGDILLGATIGGSILYTIHSGTQIFFGDESVGLGDVKLIMAGGIWLGPEYILIGLAIGAFIGCIHGVFVAISATRKAQVKTNIGMMTIPAGPGFAIGLIIAAVGKFMSLPVVLFS